MGRFSGKVAIVTASTDGIGLAIAEGLASDGAKVMISSRKQSNVDKAVDTLRKKGYCVSGTICHVADKEHRQKLIEKTLGEFGGIDFLVSNAAVNPIFGSILDVTEEAWDKIFDVNVKAMFFLIKAVVPYMQSRKGGSIVIISSHGGYMPSEFMGPYCISKTTLLGMVKAFAPQLARDNIRINCVAPGLIKTRFSEALWKNEASEDHKNKIAMQRFGEPNECVGAVSFLLSDQASYITGETILVNGGVHCRL